MKATMQTSPGCSGLPAVVVGQEHGSQGRLPMAAGETHGPPVGVEEHPSTGNK